MQISAPLLLQLGAVLTALALLGALARRLALSPIPLYLLAGLWLGKGGILPVTEASVFIKTGAPIGVVLLLLTLGLEFSSAEFASSMKQHVPSALVDVVLNATPGAIAGWLLGLPRHRHPGAGRGDLRVVVRSDRAIDRGPQPGG